MAEERVFLAIALAGFCLALAGGLYLRFGYSIDDRLLPPSPPKPAPPDPRALKTADFTPAMFEAYLAKDCDEIYRVPRVSLEELSRPFAYDRQEDSRTIAPGDPPIETQALRISLHTRKLEAAISGGTYSTDHLVLTIENKSAAHLAYRVVTAPDTVVHQCMGKGDIPHNAVALPPQGKIERTECVYRKGSRLRVDLIETIVLPELSYYYVSRLVPAHIGMDVRSSRGHAPPLGEACGTIPEQAIRAAFARKTATWRDVVDYYGRHRCDTYLFPVGYRAFTPESDRRLPWSG